jgi:hypothetical protein
MATTKSFCLKLTISFFSLLMLSTGAWEGERRRATVPGSNMDARDPTFFN